MSHTNPKSGSSEDTLAAGRSSWLPVYDLGKPLEHATLSAASGTTASFDTKAETGTGRHP